MSAPPAPKKARRSEMNDDSILCDDDDGPDSPFTLYFIQLTDIEVAAPEVKNLKMCYGAACKAGITPKWIDADEVERLHTSDDFFVVPCFRGKLFRKLQARNFRVFGPPIVLECLHEPKELPVCEHAVFSSVFDGAKISFTCVEPEKRRELIEKVSWMGGVIGLTLYHESTHLVCGKAEMSPKYEAAVKNSITLMKTDWIDDLWTESQITPGKFSALNKNAEKAYALRVFEGMEMAITSVDGADRTSLMQLVEEHGGKLPGSMTKSRCTHLITDQTTSQKYKKAMDWKINIVQTRWVRKCIDLGHLIDERKYHPSLMSVEHMRSSTPKRDANMTETGPDVSSIAGHGGRLNVSSMNTSNVLTPNSSTIFGRNRSSMVSSSTSVVASSTLGDVTLQNTTKRRSDQFATPIARTTAVPLLRHSTAQSVTAPPAVNDPIDELRKLAHGQDDLFENCMVYMCGVAEDQKEKWWRFLNQTGATRVRNFESATNVIVLAPSQEEKVTIRKFSNQDDIAIVNVGWVMECVKQKTMVSHEGFEWSESQPEDSQQSIPPTASLSRQTSAMSCKTSLTSYSEPPPVQAKGIFGTHSYSIHKSIPKNQHPLLKKRLKENGGLIEEKPECAEFVVCSHSYDLNDLLTYDTVITRLYVDTCIANEQRHKLADHALFVPLPRPPIPVFNQKLFFLHSESAALREFVTEIIQSRGGAVVEENNPKAMIVVMDQVNKVVPVSRNQVVVDLSLIVASMSECRVQAVADHLYKSGTEPLTNYQREDDVWSKSLREKDTTQEIEELEEEEERNRVVVNDEEPERENRKLTGMVNPYFPDLRKPYKMNLKLEGISQIIDAMPSPIRTPETQDSLTTSRVGSILRKAAYNTGLRREDREEAEVISRPPSSVIAENRRTVSSTPVLQRKPDRQRHVDLDESLLEQNQEHVEELNRRYAMHPHFLTSISELDPAVVEQINNGIRKLGGIIEQSFSKDVSILITSKMNRTPKTLSAIAAGKWCLSPDYVFQSVAAGHWLDDEKPFEWTPAKLLSLNRKKPESKSAEIERSLARVCSEWRVRVARMPITCSVNMEARHNGAFSGWRCVAHLDDKKALGVLAILEAGGAVVNTVSEYVEVAGHRPTMAVASKEFDWNIQSAALLKRQGVPVYNIDYIYQFLVQTNERDFSNFLHSNYQNC